jgi:hypothetical protein
LAASYEKSNHRDKIRRIKYFPCAIELIENSRFEPISKKNPNRSSEILHRFVGSTPGGDQFVVQIKEENSSQKWLVSIFPKSKNKKGPSANLWCINHGRKPL